MTSPAKQAAFEKVKRLWIAIPTPFDASGEIDEPALKVSVDYYIEALEVDGIFCGGVMGEFWALTLAERRRCHELVMERPRAGCRSWSTPAITSTRRQWISPYMPKNSGRTSPSP